VRLRSPRRPVLLGLPVALIAAAAPFYAHASGAAKHPGTLRIVTLSTRADLVSGGDVLTQVVTPVPLGAAEQPPGRGHAAIHVRLNGRNVSRQFAWRRNGRFEGLLQGLRLGRNRVVASGWGQTARLTITNHPRGGPDFTGPQIQPWACQPGAKDTKCDEKPSYEFEYMPSVVTSPGGVGVPGIASPSSFQRYDPNNPPPAPLIAKTTTNRGVTVPFIIRVETGYIDRDQYQIATLFDPKQPWRPWAPQKSYNHRLVITHGASCDTTYGTGAAPSVTDTKLLGAGFILMSNALDNAGHNCNLITEAESLVMTKEYVIDHYGGVEWTIGTGCSGGSLVQQQVANAYPGLYQGITPQCSFTDAWSSAMEYVDYTILLDYFEHPSKWGTGIAWTPTALQQVFDHPNIVNPISFTTVIPNSANPSRACPDVPDSRVYDPKTNPHGVKCTLQDYMVNVFGKRKDGFANRPFGNDGIQYGLQGLLNGELTKAQFVDLNTKVGGLTYNDRYRKARSRPDRIGLARAYRSGAVDEATNLDKVAIIDLRGPDPGAFHDVYRTYAMRARLLRNFGTAANQVLWRGQVPLIGDATFADSAVLAEDRWLSRVHADHRHISLARKILLDKPTDITDRCTNGDGVDIPSWECDAVVAAYGTPRMAAGMPAADDILECKLVPMHRSDYPVHFTARQWSALKQTFPHGVCDYDVRGVDQRPTVGWLRYQKLNGHVIYGGTPMGPAPRSAVVHR
jgi:uncharacterized tannase-like protein DUF6351